MRLERGISVTHLLNEKIHKKVDSGSVLIPQNFPCIRCSITSFAERGETAGFFFLHSKRLSVRPGRSASLNRLGGGFQGCEQRYLGTTRYGFLRKQLQAIYSASSATLADPSCCLIFLSSSSHHQELHAATSIRT